MEKENQKKYISEWVEFFKKKYGENPKCEVCGKALQWSKMETGKLGMEVVHFDHRNNGKALIEGPPFAWFKCRHCILEYQNIWNQCDFGILCGVCNCRLPTKNRKQWLENIIKYINYKEV